MWDIGAFDMTIYWLVKIELKLVGTMVA